MNNMENQVALKNKALLFSRCEGGNVQLMDFDLYEDDLPNYDGQAIKKDVFNKTFKKTLVTRVVKFDKKYIHAFFFADGSVYDCSAIGFKKREDYENKEWINRLAKEKANG